MASLITRVVENYDQLMAKADPRMENYFMMSSPVPCLIVTFLYFYIVQYAGPKFMENRKPYDLRKAMIAYNFGMVLLSGYIFMEFGLSGWFVGYSLRCQPVDYSTSPQAMRMARVSWLFHLTKYIELLDTVIFVLRKKNNQVSFLHVFHHGVLPIQWWFGVKFVPGGNGTFPPMVNSLIHFLMYSYYGLAAMGPHMQKYLWWKKYMTKLQILQFLMVTLHSTQLLFIECNYPKVFVYIIVSQSVFFFFLFGHFYIKAYLKNKIYMTRSKDKPVKPAENGVSNGYKKD